MKNFFKKYALGMIFFIVTIFFAVLIHGLSKPTVFFEKTKINGVVIKKYRAFGVRNDLFDIRNFNDTEAVGVCFDSFIENQLKVGDTLYKEKNMNYVIRGNKKDTLFCQTCDASKW